jgi:uncharacterized protein YprB with RNaseH-like and TPR domain
MPSLTDRLKSLGVKIGAQDLPSPRLRSTWPVEDVVSGRFLDTPGGQTFVVEAFYQPEYSHGRSLLGLKVPPHTIAAWAGNPAIANHDSTSYAFLDTETSGLAGGTGTYAFMVGAGRYTQHGFQLLQFFMRDPSEEPALLLALEEFLAPCRTLVTFNGKSFDIPLLNTRYTLQGWKSPFKGLGHIDLLHLARRLWRESLPSRTLSNLEVQILGASRTEDEVPGWMIPQMYFDYLREGDARPLKRVFYHNAIDVVSLAALLNHTSSMLEDPDHFPNINGFELIATAHLCAELGQVSRAIHLYQHSLETSLPIGQYLGVIENLSLLYKRQADYASAIPLWEAAAQVGGIFACEELAKYYEHHSQDLEQAIHWTRIALDHVLQPKPPIPLKFTWQAELEHRKKRLERKLSDQKNKFIPSQ